MQLIYENKFQLEELSMYHYLLVGVNYCILIKNDHIQIQPMDYKYMNFDRTILENNTGILWNFFVLIPLSGVILTRLKNYKYFVLQHNKDICVNELWFIVKENSEYVIKEKVQWWLKLWDIKEGLDEDIFTFIKRLH
jgi:hypothetical protein